MSWSISQSGKQEEIAKSLEEAFDSITFLQGDEKDLKELAKIIVLKAVNSYSRSYTVNVSASGHASFNGESKAETLSISINPS